MSFVVLKTIQIFVPLLANLALVWFLLLHSHGSWVRCVIVRVNNGECAVAIFVQALVLMAVLLYC